MRTYDWIDNDIRSFVTGIINSYTMVDYGVVTGSADDTVDVDILVASKQKEAKTKKVSLKGVRLLYPSSKMFSIKWKIDKGDRVLLLGTKNYIPDLEATKASVASVGQHYDLDTLLAYPLSAFNGDASIVMQMEEDNITSKIKGAFNGEVGKDFEITIKGKAKITVEGDSTIYSKGKSDIQSDGKCTVSSKGGVDVKGSRGTLKVM